MSSNIEIRREISPERINFVSNLPGVHPFIAYHGKPLDWSTAFPARQTGVMVLSDGAEAIGVFAMTADREWQIHTMFGPDCRGRKAIATGLAMLEYMRPWADRFWGATPMSNRGARWFNRQVGFVSIGTDHYEAEGEVELFEKRYNHG